jgi:hypothetical protein
MYNSNLEQIARRLICSGVPSEELDEFISSFPNPQTSDLLFQGQDAFDLELALWTSFS